MGWRMRCVAGRSWCSVAVTTFAVLAGGGADGQAAENPALARTYGSGVHAYFSGAYDRSYDDMTAVIEAGSEDPRALYFRGLAALKMGRLDEAEADFSSGAELEVRARGNWRVSPALERVQGSDRLQLERHRVRARVAAVQMDRVRETKRYSDIDASQRDVLRIVRPDGGASEPGGPFATESQPDTRRPAAREPEPMPDPEPSPGPVGTEDPPRGDAVEAERDGGLVGDPPAAAEEVGAGEVMREDPSTQSGDVPAEPEDRPVSPVDTPVTAEEPAVPAAPAEPADPAGPGAAAESTGESAAGPAEPMAEDEGKAAGDQ